MTGLSRTEAGALILKAAAGAGMDWGMAEEAAMAAGWFAARSLPWAPGFAALLSALPAGPLHRDAVARRWRAAGAACPITLGAALCDFAELPGGDLRAGAVDLGPVVQPVLLLPFAALLAEGLQRSVALVTVQGRVIASPSGQALGDLSEMAAVERAHVSMATTDDLPVFVRPMPVPLHLTDLHLLEALALKTTVPASETSRRGAGAGALDND